MNATELALKCFHDIKSSKLCHNPLWIHVEEIPDVVHEAYFIFAFVRDPFTRVVSLHHEMGRGGFTGIVSGNLAKVSQDAHFYGQVQYVLYVRFHDL